MGDLVHPVEHGCRLGAAASIFDKLGRNLSLGVNNDSRDQALEGCHIAVDLVGGCGVEKFARYVDYFRDFTEDYVLVADPFSIDIFLDLKSLIDERVEKPVVD